ncbi:hypothetical protein A2U01_0067981, partial [Trifolium medium]|nr:hypothetical protein [Trifolium medium]
TLLLCGTVDNLLRYDPPHIDWLHSCDAMQLHQTCFVHRFIARCGKNDMLQELFQAVHYSVMFRMMVVNSSSVMVAKVAW